MICNTKIRKIFKQEWNNLIEANPELELSNLQFSKQAIEYSDELAELFLRYLLQMSILKSATKRIGKQQLCDVLDSRILINYIIPNRNDYQYILSKINRNIGISNQINSGSLTKDKFEPINNTSTAKKSLYNRLTNIFKRV